MEQVTAAQDGATGETGGVRTAEPGLRRPLRRAGGDTVRRVLLIVVVVAAVAVRLYNGSALWLDEALSVNIASLPARDVFGALKVDGSPPLYYLLLHFWVDLVGTDDLRVRWLSSLFAVAALPIAYLLGRRFGGRRVGELVLLLAAFNPFLIRYATEARMYSLVVLLTLLVLLATVRAHDQPSPGRLAGLAVAAGLLSLTHYWALFFLAALWLGLAAMSVRGREVRRFRRLLVGLSCGGVLFLPWVPSFLFQVKHTGTPWADPPGPGVLVSTVREWAGGSQWPATTLAVVLALLMVMAFRPSSADSGVPEDARARPFPAMPAAALLGCSIGALLIGLTASRLLGAGFAVRYSSAMIGAALLLAAVGGARLARAPRMAAVVLVCGLGLVSAIPLLTSTSRTQAAQTAQIIGAQVQPGDLVLYCPDQLGPAVSRMLPGSVSQVSYPTLAAPQRVDWVDYAQRNAAASPELIARAVSQRAAGRIFLVAAPHYLTFGQQCEQVAATLAALRGAGVVLQRQDTHFYESESVTAFPRSAGG